MNKQLYYKDIIEVLILLAICLVPFAVMPGYQDITQLPKILLLIFLVFIITMIWLISEKGKLILVKDNVKIHILLGAYFVLLLVSTINAYKIEYAIFGKIKWWEGLISLTTYILLTIFSSYYFRINDKKIKLMIMTSTLISFYGIMQYFGFYLIKFPEVFITKEYVLSTMGNPNFLGSFIVLFMPLSMYLFMKHKKIVYLVSFSNLHLCLLMTKTRSAWLGIIVSIIIFFYYSFKFNRFKRELSILIILMILITLVFDISTGGLFIRRFLTIGRDFLSVVEKTPDYDRAGSSRVFIWERVVKLIYKKPLFGHGLDNLGLVFDDYFGDDTLRVLGKRIWIDKAHNDLLHVAVSSGIPSMLVYVCFIYNVVKKGFKNTNVNLDILPIYCGVIGYLVQAFFNISVVAVAYIYWIYMGILIKGQNSIGEEMR